MTKQELKAKIDKLENGIKSKATPSNLIAPLKAQKAKLQKELEDMEASEKKAVKTKKVSKVAEKIKAAKTSVAKKTPAKAPAKEERKKDNIARDGDRKSLPAGKRISKTGKVYYEMRANRTDKQTSVKPYLADGGKLANGKYKYEKGDEGMFQGDEVRVVKYTTSYGGTYEYNIIDENGQIKTHGVAKAEKFENQFRYFPKMEIGGFLLGAAVGSVATSLLSKKSSKNDKTKSEDTKELTWKEKFKENVNQEGFDSAVTEYSEDIKDKRFNELKTDYLVKSKALKKYIGSKDVIDSEYDISVQDAIDSEGFDYALVGYNDWKGVEDNKFQTLYDDYKKSQKSLDKYVGTSKSYADGGELTEKKLLVLKADDEKGGNVFVSEEVVKVKDLDDAKSKVKEFVSKYNLDDKTFTGGRYFKLVKASKKTGNVTSSDVKSEELGTIDYKGNFKSSGSKMADGGETDWGADLGGGFSIGNDVYITDSKSLFQGKTGFVSGSVGRDLLVTILDNGNERSVVVSKKGVQKLDAPEYADGGELKTAQLLIIDSSNPLSTQVKKITGDFLNSNDYKDISVGNFNILTHKDSKKIFIVYPKRIYDSLPEQEKQDDINYLKNVEKIKLDTGSMADGGYVIFEGRDNYNDKPLYKVISKDEDNDYDGEFHDNREDAEKELKELKNKDMNYGYGGKTKSRKSMKDLTIEQMSSMTGVGKAGIERFSDENNLSEEDLSNIMQGLGRRMISASDFATAVSGNKDNQYTKEIVDFAKSGKGYKMAKGGEVPAHFGSGKNIDVFGYQTKNFDICGTAVKEFESAAEIMKDGKESYKEALAYCAKYVDNLFGIEKAVVEGGVAGELNFSHAVSDIMSAAIYNYRAEMSINLFSFVPQHLQEIAVRMVKAEKGGLYALGGMTAGRWYKDKSGEEFKFIGKNDDTGELIFSDGSKRVTKTLEDFEGGRPKENKLFGFFADGGSVAEGNYEMLMSNIKAIKHHAEELQNVAKPNTEIEAWVLSKSERAETDLSDITHYLDGLKMADGGYMADGGEVRFVDEFTNKDGIEVQKNIYENSDIQDYTATITMNPLFRITRADSKDEVVKRAKEIQSEMSEYLAKNEGRSDRYKMRDFEKGGYMADGGKVKFADKVKSVQESLLKRKKVSPKVQKDYGKTYSKAEAKESAQRIVGSRMAELKEKMAKKKK